MERKIEKRDNFISIEAAENELCEIKIGEMKPLVFIVPYNCLLNLYIKREAIPIQFK